MNPLRDTEGMEMRMAVVTLYAGLRELAGMREIRLDGAKLRDILTALVDRHPQLRQDILDGTVLRPHVIVTVNGRNVNLMDGLDMPVTPDDAVAIFPPIAGG